MYIISQVNVLLTNEMPFALRSTFGGGISKPGFRHRRGWAIYMWGGPRSRRI
jgi:hypothetical protein